MKKIPLLIIGLICLLTSSVDARFPRGGGSAGGSSPSVQITNASFSLLNNGASTTPTSFVTNMFTQSFISCSMAAEQGVTGQCIANGCSTGAPILKDHSSSTVLKFSESTAPICWPDGSLRTAAFLMIWTNGSAGITAGQSKTIDVYSGGSTPTASGRATSDFNPSGGIQNCDFNTQVTPLDTSLGSGTWVADLYDAVLNNGHEYPLTGLAHRNQGADYVDVDGPAGTVWRIRAQFKQSGTAQGQLETWFYVQELQDLSGNFYGMRELGRTTLPYYNNPCVGSTCANQTMMSFSTYYLCNGHTTTPFCSAANGGLVADLWTNHETLETLTQSSAGGPGVGTNIVPSSGTTLYGRAMWEFGTLLRFTTIPAGSAITAGTDYFANNGDGPNSPYTNNVTLNTASNVVSSNTSFNCTTNPCVYTATAYPYLTPFGSLYDGNVNAEYNYAQCGGTGPSSDVNVQILPAVYNWRKAGVLPSFSLADKFPYQGTISGNPQTGDGTVIQTTYTPIQTTFWPMVSGATMTRGLLDTGERIDIGIMPGWETDYFNEVANSLSSIANEVNSRATGLALGNWPINVRDFGTNTLPTVNDGHANSGNDYPNLIGVCVNATGQTCSFTTGTPCTSTSICPQWNKFAYNGENPANTIGLSNPTNTNVMLAGYNGFQNTSHWPMPQYAAWLITGEPQFRDMLIEQGDKAVYTRVQGLSTSTINSTTIDWGGSATDRNFHICNNPSTSNNCTSGATYTDYYGVTLNSGNEIRLDAWAHNAVAEAAFALSPEKAGASEQLYLQDMDLAFSGAFNTFQAWEANTNSWAGGNGVFNEGAPQLTPWTFEYFAGAVGFSYQLTLNPGDMSAFLDLLKWPNYVDQITDGPSGHKVGPPYIAAYEYLVRGGTNPTNTSQYIFPTSAPDLDANGSHMVGGGEFFVTYLNSNSNVFTLNPSNVFGAGYQGYQGYAGDTVFFCGIHCGAGGGGNTIPTGFSSNNTPYYIFNLGGGGSAITFNLGAYSSTCNETTQSGCVAVSYTANGTTSADAEIYTSHIVGLGTGITACGVAPYTGSPTCPSMGTIVGTGGSSYAAAAYGALVIGQAAYNFYLCQPAPQGVGTCSSTCNDTGTISGCFGGSNSNSAQMFTDMQNMLQSDGNFPTAYGTTGGTKYTNVPHL